jgi:DTW domain-containing protein YfiP
VKPKLRWSTRASLGKEAAENGFTVTKIQKKKSKLTGEVTELEDFSITIPPHSALLFPCQRAVSIDALDCQVKHLIVLDGTWAKAQRMYHENPWLQLLPHVMLDSDRVSLYSEVRHEPKAGCLSTIESIVVTMKKLGEDEEGLDDVLGVFESMIVDQRRFKEENWKPKLK